MDEFKETTQQFKKYDEAKTQVISSFLTAFEEPKVSIITPATLLRIIAFAEAIKIHELILFSTRDLQFLFNSADTAHLIKIHNLLPQMYPTW